MNDLVYNRQFTPNYGVPVKINEHIHRITCQNAGPLTFFGTNTFLLGSNELAIIDPGPMNTAHLEALIAAIAGRPVKCILISHTHVDHSPLSRSLAEKTGAPIWGAPKHHRAPAFAEMPENPLEASADTDYEPDMVLEDGDEIIVDNIRVETLATPGHTINHLSFALPDSDIIFAADHVMAWSTTGVAPPDGSMTHYMNSLEKFIERDHCRFLPAHGGEVLDPPKYLRALKSHRQEREGAILKEINSGTGKIHEMVTSIYTDVDKKLHGAAALNVLAHLEDLVSRDLVICEGPLSLSSQYKLR
ncbi:MBL fold metallo-hydrolase [Flexibacterium corallicola]|uniref:MBL fold metallo-hydrolase n=1 Tax=Flexibacterium corallicola TaxID=3037259 RepID=UPI00286EF6C7|nr:MBL fold metallo-hydrolase [Pseudovibrio sp. M1P-2-3]